MATAYERTRGFTFVEILVVAVVVAILTTMAYPSYQEAVRKSRRAEGKAALMQVMQQQERYYSLHNSYIAFSSGSTGGDEKRFKWYSGESPARSAYEIRAAACKDESIRDCVLLIAEPGTSAVNPGHKDAACGSLTLSSTGEKGADGPDCWN
ncbi:type IV pilin protein [Noviherbaspirillum massiliense]|uniref:type IV pilin protein n=1 Tax=Noviherbaspirillum massiliense TaxID=1465823 RepID=UPI0003172C39|nr:type IV pilin protein [Noviherbaspirillum massiliense]